MKQINMEFKTFEEALQEEHSKNYMGTDDDMPDKFDAWVERLDTEDLIKLADKYGTFKSKR